MTAFDWFKKRNEFYRNYANEKILKTAQAILDGAVNETEKDIATQAVEAVKKAIKLFDDAIAAGDTAAGLELEHEGLEQIKQSQIDTDLAEQAKAYFANGTTSP